MKGRFVPARKLLLSLSLLTYRIVTQTSQWEHLLFPQNPHRATSERGAATARMGCPHMITMHPCCTSSLDEQVNFLSYQMSNWHANYFWAPERGNSQGKKTKKVLQLASVMQRLIKVMSLRSSVEGCFTSWLAKHADDENQGQEFWISTRFNFKKWDSSLNNGRSEK